MAAPIPRDEPVTSAFLPVSRKESRIKGFSLWFAGVRCYGVWFAAGPKKTGAIWRS
jgi:hypothetical protein